MSKICLPDRKRSKTWDVPRELKQLLIAVASRLGKAESAEHRNRDCLTLLESLGAKPEDGLNLLPSLKF